MSIAVGTEGPVRAGALGTLLDGAGAPGPLSRLSDGRIEQPVTRGLSGAGTLVVRKPAEAAVGSADAPASESKEWLTRQSRHELDVYGKRGLALVSGKGSRVRDADGNEYIDCIGGYGALALGHRHPVLQAALAEQANHMWMVPGAFGSPPRTRFLQRLHEVLPPELDRTFLSNSGAEAMEAALKIARAHTGRTNFVGAVRGFHGRTLGALSITAEARYREPFEPLLGSVRRVPLNDPRALEEAVDSGVAAVVLEPVQGEGGVHVAHPEFLLAARAACDEMGALLVFDEVQTGFGRTGRFFAFEHSGVVPDVLCLAKSIAGGLPLGATVVRSGISLELGTHGSTFGGNPIACAVARATLDVLLDSDLINRVEGIGDLICRPTRELEPGIVREIRQVGLMIGIQLKKPDSTLRARYPGAWCPGAQRGKECASPSSPAGSERWGGVGGGCDPGGRTLRPPPQRPLINPLSRPRTSVRSVERSSRRTPCPEAAALPSDASPHRHAQCEHPQCQRRRLHRLRRQQTQ